MERMSRNQKDLLRRLKRDKHPLEWGKRTLTDFPDTTRHYVTGEQMEVMNFIDKRINDMSLSLIPSEASLNKCLQLLASQNFNKEQQFFGKHYYKQYYIEWKKKK